MWSVSHWRGQYHTGLVSYIMTWEFRTILKKKKKEKKIVHLNGDLNMTTRAWDKVQLPNLRQEKIKHVMYG